MLTIAGEFSVISLRSKGFEYSVSLQLEKSKNRMVKNNKLIFILPPYGKHLIPRMPDLKIIYPLVIIFLQYRYQL